MTFPILLAQGVCRFDILWNESLDVDNNDDPKIDRLNYFKGILDETDHLNELGWWDISQLVEGESPDDLLHRIHNFYADVANDLP